MAIPMDILEFLYQPNYLYKCEYPNWYPKREIHVGMFCNSYAWNISMNRYTCFYGFCPIIHVFMDINLNIHGVLWVSMDGLAMDSRSRAGFFGKESHAIIGEPSVGPPQSLYWELLSRLREQKKLNSSFLILRTREKKGKTVFKHLRIAENHWRRRVKGAPSGATLERQFFGRVLSPPSTLR